MLAGATTSCCNPCLVPARQPSTGSQGALGGRKRHVALLTWAALAAGVVCPAGRLPCGLAWAATLGLAGRAALGWTVCRFRLLLLLLLSLLSPAESLGAQDVGQQLAAGLRTVAYWKPEWPATPFSAHLSVTTTGHC